MSRRGSGMGVTSFLSGISVAARIAAAIVIISLLSLVVATIIGLRSGTELGEDLYEDRLVAMRSSGARDVATELASLERTLEALRISPQASIATERLSAAFQELLAEPLDDDRERATRLAEAYQESYLEPLGEAGLDVDVRDVVDAGNTASLYLQSTYSIDFEPLRRAAAVDDARDGTEWSDVHRRVQPAYRQIVDELGLVDLLIVDAATGYVVYTVNKRPDLGANLFAGALSGSISATLVDSVLDDPSDVAVEDFGRYIPSLSTPVAGMAGAIPGEDGGTVGALVLLFDSAELTRILTADQDWDAAGFPPEGESYLIGPDGTTRTEPRGFLEDPPGYLDAAEANGQLNDEERAVITASDTTVLALPAVDATIKAAEDGDTSVGRGTTIDGREAFGTVEAVPYDGVDWTVASEVGADEARAGIEDFRAVLVAGISIYVVVLAFVAVAWAGWIMRPVRAVSDRLGRFDAGDHTPIAVGDRSPVEFHRLAASYEDAGHALLEQRDELAAARSERLDLMRQMLPAAVAERLASGDAGAPDEFLETSVVVLTLVGLEVEQGPESNGSDREMIEGLLAELDEIAQHRGLEPIKVIGDEYYAACGHERPYIDHAPRAVAFVAEAFAAVAHQTTEGGTDLRVSGGVASGPVTVGLTGTDGLVYDVWGTTVRRADQLVRRAGRGQLLISDETMEKLPDSVGVTAVDEVTGQMAWEVDLTSVGEHV